MDGGSAVVFTADVLVDIIVEDVVALVLVIGVTVVIVDLEVVVVDVEVWVGVGVVVFGAVVVELEVTVDVVVGIVICGSEVVVSLSICGFTVELGKGDVDVCVLVIVSAIPAYEYVKPMCYFFTYKLNLYQL